MENENERSIIAAALDEALRDQVKRLFAVLTISMVDMAEAISRATRRKNASPSD